MLNLEWSGVRYLPLRAPGLDEDCKVANFMRYFVKQDGYRRENSNVLSDQIWHAYRQAVGEIVRCIGDQVQVARYLDVSCNRIIDYWSIRSIVILSQSEIPRHVSSVCSHKKRVVFVFFQPPPIAQKRGVHTTWENVDGASVSLYSAHSLSYYVLPQVAPPSGWFIFAKHGGSWTTTRLYVQYNFFNTLSLHPPKPF